MYTHRVTIYKAPILFSLSNFKDTRGRLLVLDEIAERFFVPRRFFTISHVPVGTIRGEHGHRKCKQIIANILGDIFILWNNSQDSGQFHLRAGEALFVPNGIWLSIKFITENSLIVVISSENYEQSDYFYEISELRKEFADDE